MGSLCCADGNERVNVDTVFARTIRQAGVRSGVVLHLGAHLGEEDALYQRLGLTPAYVEAQPSTFERLRRIRAERCCIHAAVGRIDGGTATLHVAEPDACSSLLKRDSRTTVKTSGVKLDVTAVSVPRRTVDSICAEWEIKPIALTYDIQGAELDALRGSTIALAGARVVWCEVWKRPLYGMTALIADVEHLLMLQGFRRVAYVPGSNPAWGDGFYVRTGGPR